MRLRSKIVPGIMRAVVIAVLTAGVSRAGPESRADILGQAEARIERVREGDGVLRLIGPSGKPLKRGERVKIVETRHKFLFGSNIFMLGKCRTPEQNARYAERFDALLNYATVPFYWWAYEPRPGEPNYDSTEKVLAWCRGHGVTAKGHPLAWNWMDPAWLPPDPGAAMRAQFERIEKCAGRFKGEISFWDVVNEATEYDRAETERQGPILTEGIRQMGVPAYLGAAFEAARRSNPEARLVINDYRTDPSYAEKVISQLVDQSGRPLYDIIGIQCHQHRGAWPAEKIWDICERFGKFGRPLHFTEATILSGKLGYDLKKNNPRFDWSSTVEGEERQAREVERFYTVLFSHPAVEAITWWDFSDQGAWQGAPAGLLRQDMTPKPAYEVLMRLIKGKWWTRTETAVGKSGEARFRGFYGDYAVSVEVNSRVLTGTFSFDKETHAPIEVRLK